MESFVASIEAKFWRLKVVNSIDQNVSCENSLQVLKSSGTWQRGSNTVMSSFETKLSDEEYHRSVSVDVVTLVDSSVQSSIGRVMNALPEPTYISHFSWAAAKEKKQFKNTKTCNLVIRTVHSCHQQDSADKRSTVDAIVTSIQHWFHNSRDRLKSRVRKRGQSPLIVLYFFQILFSDH
uniref:Uncharacterized protein n=1 Tax=Trichobilharzia regenti TaxID=157069 RepID=A0AA85KKM6_TRIRE|nr:unnamed protein product [Trichobilharzia regenti]